MTNEITTRGRFPSPENWQAITAISEELSKSKALPASIQNPAQLTMVLLAGKESGMGVIESLNSYYIVNGKITIYGQAVLIQLKRAGYRVKWGQCDEKSATSTILHPDGSESTETFTVAEAVKAGNTGKDVWQKHGKSMLRWKSLAANIRFNCPEVLYGHYVAEDVQTAVKGEFFDSSEDLTDPHEHDSEMPTEDDEANREAVEKTS